MYLPISSVPERIFPNNSHKSLTYSPTFHISSRNNLILYFTIILHFCKFFPIPIKRKGKFKCYFCFIIHIMALYGRASSSTVQPIPDFGANITSPCLYTPSRSQMCGFFSTFPFLPSHRASAIPAIATNTEINCEVDRVPTLPLSRSPRKNSMIKRPTL